MTTEPTESVAPDKNQHRISRRGLLVGASAVGGAMVGTAAGYAAGLTTAPAGPGHPNGSIDLDHRTVSPGLSGATVQVSAPIGTDTIPFYGDRQAGIDTPPPAHAVFIALNLRAETDRDALRRMLVLLTDDAARLTQGQAALADIDEELAAAPARLTVTFGFGPAVVDLINPAARPDWLAPLPHYGIDQLDPAWSGGDLLLQICGDNPLSVAHTRRMLLKDARAFATVHWVQTGFRAARGAHPENTTMRNLFGQVDGTVNPQAGSETCERLVWGRTDPELSPLSPTELTPWIDHGTSMVIRRIAMDLDDWDELDRPAQEQVIGRRLGSGAPLTGEHEHDDADFAALGPAGFPVISDIAHIRRSRTGDPNQAMLRRGYNYDDPPRAGSRADEVHGHTGVSQAGMIFTTYQADVLAQYHPIQQRLAETDHLNLWTVPIGSAVFAIPPGCAPGGFIGEQLYA